jgi:hypothetical protein
MTLSLLTQPSTPSDGRLSAIRVISPSVFRRRGSQQARGGGGPGRPAPGAGDAFEQLEEHARLLRRRPAQEDLQEAEERLGALAAALAQPAPEGVEEEAGDGAGQRGVVASGDDVDASGGGEGVEGGGQLAQVALDVLGQGCAP